MGIVKRKIEKENKKDNDVNFKSEVTLKEKRNLYMKAQRVIKNAIIEKYIKDSETIEKEGLTFWGTLTGKNALQMERIKNIKLKIELLQVQRIEEKNDYEYEDILADIYSCAILELNGKFTEQMRSLYENIKYKYKDYITVSDDDIYKMVYDKVEKGQKYLPVIHKEKTKRIFGDIRAQITFYKSENKRLEDQIQFERGKCQFETFKNKVIPLKKAILTN